MTRPHPVTYGLSAALGLALLATACQPTVKIVAPDKPITINVNIRITIEKEAEKVIAQKKELF